MRQAADSKLPTISLVTACYNAELTLEETITNVFSQGYPKLEYIIMDGGSKDRSLEIIKKYSDQLAAWSSGPDEGQYDAINKGFEKSDGEIMGWINADDMYLPGALILVGEIFRDFPEVEWISSLRPGGWDADGFFTGTGMRSGFSKSAFEDGYHLDGLRKRAYCIQQESTFWRRSLWDRIGASIPMGYPLAGDYALWSKFFEHADLVGVDYPIGGFRSLQGQRSADIQRYRQEAIKVMQDRNCMPNPLMVACCNFMHSLIYRSGPMNRFFTNQWGYTGKRIFKSNPSMRNAAWSMREIKYFV